MHGMGNFYKTYAWKRKRAEIKERDNNECQKCKARGKARVGQVYKLDVHHIKHLNKHWSLRLTDSNLITLCVDCHNEEHPEKLKEYKGEIHAERF